MTGAATHRLREKPEHPAHRVGVGREHAHELAAAKRERRRIGDGCHGRRAFGVVEQRQLAEHVTAALERDHDFAAGVVGDRDLHGAGDDEEHLAGIVVAVEHDLVPGEVARPHLRRDRDPLDRGEAGEDRALREEVGDRGDIHLA